MIKKLVTVAAASTFLMATTAAFAQDATNPPKDATGTAPMTAPSDTTGAAGTTTDTTGTDAAAGTTTTDTTTGTAANSTAASSTSTDSAEVAGTYLTEQGENQMSADSYIGTTVYNSNNESIGEINDLIIEKNGGIVAAVIGVGGFLGIGEKNVAVPIANIMATQKEDGSDLKLTTNETSDTLKNAPEFKTLDQTHTAATPAADGTNATGTAPVAPAPGTTETAPATTETAPATGTSN